MNKTSRLFSLRQTVLVIGLAISLFTFTAASSPTVNWPQFRGPDGCGVSDTPAPVTWNIETGENVRWQTTIPGLGHSCPIVWQDRLYVTTAVQPGITPELKIGLYGAVDSYAEHDPQQWRLLCIDKVTGKILWDKLKLESIPKSQRHTKASHCNSTPATDGEHIVAIFGSEGMFGFDMNGKQLWRQDLGRMDAGWYVQKNTPWGFGSSPVLHEGRVIVQCDVVSEQYLAAYDVRDGHQIWKTTRKDVPSWCSPLIVSSPKRTQIIVNGWKELGGYDFATGKQLWNLGGGGDIPVPTPILADQLVIFTSAHGPLRPMRAVRLEATGDITPASGDDTSAGVAWSQARKGSYLQTPILVGNLLFGNMDGVLTCFDAKTGEVKYNERIGGGGQGFTASPVAANGKIYYPGEQGDVFVVPATGEFSVLATNKLGGLCLSSPAISEGTLFFRTTGKLVAIGFNK
jgi:outer membrane protein assembly factor BamB